MTHLQESLPIVVGIDGSGAAVAAARWAVDEAIIRDVPLQLVHATDVDTDAGGPGEDFTLYIRRAEPLLRAADEAVTATGKTVKVETAVVGAGPRVGLLTKSRHAAMVCVGSGGVGRAGRALEGSTAAALANAAFCPVAIIRADMTTANRVGWIVVSVGDSPECDVVVEHAFSEAALRGAPLLALEIRPCLHRDGKFDQLLQPWRHRYPDVRVQSAAAPEGLGEFVSTSKEPIQLAVIGGADASGLLRFVDQHAQPSIFDHCSVLVVRI
ncbi:universal stress protein [Mycobacterium haemophilum]|uniref:UspA domain-containing protein n=1 Tax=Mycobacterium haemophilum TaxID=29311 RepID=A0A0I9UQQ1_9MYCO|nr:universal stress protein [Mycobacterium haemophilum]AKN17869.1 hypothetical protein B586_16890 [Mycobacterium haemophilum DSM 44634]KLO33523.1 hypothetical protein ABH39_01440 [Mycobacterium haemophilum]KLO39050.1 hypothetical protein ABH38_01445 [Mycobacterium haemophilum]KLO45464.1 hypothetical protein ABH37_01445 [Mycobacterium haemophilum]KLO56616.1 hypothetical protein ABH36_01440 [Mycobacterium haemophilum]